MTDFAAFPPPFGRTEDDIRANMDAVANTGLAPGEEGYIDTRPLTAYWFATQPSVIVLARAHDRMNEIAATANIGTAWDDYLDAHAESYGDSRTAATVAVGSVTFKGDSGTIISQNVQVGPPQTDPDIDPPVFETTAAGVIGTPAPAAPSLTDSTAAGTLPAATYAYVITAVSAIGETVSSPVTTLVKTAVGQIVVNWTAVAGATSYRLYRGAATGGPYNFLAEVTGVTYTDNGGVVPDAARHPPATMPVGTLDLPVQATQSGTIGNVAAGQISVLITGVAGVQSVVNAEATGAGAEVESDPSLRERLQLLFKGGRANKAAYAAEALRQPGIGGVTVLPHRDGAGTVALVVVDDSRNAVVSTVLSQVQDHFDPLALQGQGEGWAPVNHYVTVETPQNVPIYISATVTFGPGYSLDSTGGTVGLRGQIEQALSDYVDGLDAGEDVVYNHVQAQFFRVKGVYNVTNLRIGTVSPPTGTVDIAIDDGSGTTTAQLASPTTPTLT